MRMDVTSVIRIEKIYSDKDIIDNYFEIKPEDLLEMGVKNSNTGIEVLCRYRRISTEAFLFYNEDKAIGIFGVREDSPHSAVPWMISESLDGIETSEFIKCSVKVIEQYKQKYDEMHNYTSCLNTKSHKWLEYLGFVIDKTDVVIMNNISWYRFRWRREDE